MSRNSLCLAYLAEKIRFCWDAERARKFVVEQGGELDENGNIIGTPFKIAEVNGIWRVVEQDGSVATDKRISEFSSAMTFEQEFPFFSSEVRFWQKEGKISTHFKVQRLDGDILNHTVKTGDIVLAYSYSRGKPFSEKQLEPGEKVAVRVREMFGCIPDDLYVLANLQAHIEIPELSRCFGLEKADSWTVWKPQAPFNFFYKMYEYDDVKGKDVIAEARVEKGYAISYPWSLDWAYIVVSDETFGAVRTKPMPFESWQSVADDFKVPPKEILSAKEVTKRLLNGEPWKDFENVGVNITKPLGVHQYGYRWHARGIDVPWEMLRWEADSGIPENCKNIGISQSFFLITDGKEAFIIKSLDGTRFLAMPGSDYGALVVGDSEQARKFRAEIRKAEGDMLDDSFTGYMVDKIEYDGFWYAVRVLPDGRFLLEEWSDSSTENDRWVLESVDECYNKAYELSGVPGQFYIGQEVDYWAMPGESLGSIDSDHSLLTFKLLYDSETNQYFVVSDDTSGKDEMFILESFGTAEETLAWLETAEIPEKTAKILTMLIEENEK